MKLKNRKTAPASTGKSSITKSSGKLKLQKTPAAPKTNPVSSESSSKSKPKLSLKLQPKPGVEVVTLAKDAKYDELYVNFESTPRMMRLLDKTPRANGEIKFLFWGEYHRDWLEVWLKPDYRLGTDVARLPKSDKWSSFVAHEKTAAPASDKQMAAREKFKQAAAERRAEQPKLPPGKPDGKRCFFGMIGEHKVLLDAGDGAILGKFAPAKFDAEKEAKKLKRTLVARTAATPQASKALQVAWAEARAKLKGGK